MKVLITGSNGLLGQKLVHKLKKDTTVELIASSLGVNRIREQEGYKYIKLDVRDKQAVEQLVMLEKPEVVIHTAAMTNVDLCEVEHEKCDVLNVNAVQYLANACAEIDAHLIQISTDFIFDGENGPYMEEDVPNPLSYYGLSKLRSEQVLQGHRVRWTILRTIILFGVAEQLSRSNLVLWAKDALVKGEPLNIIDDQFRAPTLAEDLADACILAARKKAYGIFNISGKDIMSIYEIVERIAKYYGIPTKNLNKINTAILKQKAVRPPKTGFILDKANKILGYQPHSFEDCLKIIDEQLNN